MYLILDSISGNITQEIEIEDFKMKEELVSIKEEGSSEEDTCTVVYVQGESMKTERTELKSKK